MLPEEGLLHPGHYLSQEDSAPQVAQMKLTAGPKEESHLQQFSFFVCDPGNNSKLCKNVMFMSTSKIFILTVNDQ